MISAIMKPIRLTITLLIMLFGHSANSQLKNTKEYSEINGPCSSNIILDSLGYFFKERGCEGSSHISFGKYKITKNNIISFSFFSFDSLEPFRKIRRYKNTNKNDSIITITLFSRENKPLGFNFNIQVFDIDGKPENVNTNEKGELFINHFLYKQLLLTQLLSIYKVAAPILIDKNSMEIYFNLPELFLIYPETILEKAEKLKLVFKKDGLYKLDGKTKLYSL